MNKQGGNVQQSGIHNCQGLEDMNYEKRIFKLNECCFLFIADFGVLYDLV